MAETQHELPADELLNMERYAHFELSPTREDMLKLFAHIHFMEEQNRSIHWKLNKQLKSIRDDLDRLILVHGLDHNG